MSELDVFISYSRDDREVAQRFAEKLSDEGLSLWWDAALQSGETFDEAIETALRAAKSVVVLWSPRSVASRWVRAEATLADRSKKLVPVIVEPCERPIMFELTHTIDLAHWHGSTSDPAWRALIKDLRRLVARADRQEAPTRAPIEPSHVPTSLPLASVSGARPLPERLSGPATASPPPRKLDNLIFRGVGTRSPRLPTASSAASDGDDRTQFYTRSSRYIGGEVHCLELSIGGRLEKRYVVRPAGLKIGRAAPADVILADSRVSRAHCIVELVDDELRVSDLNSTNGTYVDGKPVTTSTVLPVGSVLKVGSVLFRHELRTSVGA